MEIYCCSCEIKIDARLTDGREIYPHRSDLHDLPFWRCGKCGNSVGCHHKTKNPTRPLGCIPTKEIKQARQHIHKILDPLCRTGKMRRKDVYQLISDKFGWQYHTANIRSVEEAREIYKYIRQLSAPNKRLIDKAGINTLIKEGG